jgi:hypothetical protein
MNLGEIIYNRFKPNRGEETLVMNKSASIEKDGDKFVHTKIDHMDKDNELAKDVEQMKKERKAESIQLLPLFKFKEKQQKHFELYCKGLVNASRIERRNHQDKYLDILKYIKIVDYIDINFLVDLAILRNKEAYSIETKNIEIEVVSCFYEKKLRVKYDIPEDLIINVDEHAEFAEEKKKIFTQFYNFYKAIENQTPLPGKGLNKDIEVELVKSTGSDDYGAGFAIVVRYTKKIDYLNARRGRESYDLFALESLDKEFINSLSSILSTEAIADGMTEENEGEGGDDETSGGDMDEMGNDGDDESDPNESPDDRTGEGDDGTTGGDDDMGDFGGGDDFGGGGEEGDEESGGDTGGDSGGSDFGGDSSTAETKPGDNPFRDKNAQAKVAGELKELLTQIEKVITVIDDLPNTTKSNIDLQKIIGTKLNDLQSIVRDSLKLAFITPAEDSLLRYAMYLTRFNELMDQIKLSFISSHAFSNILC